MAANQPFKISLHPFERPMLSVLEEKKWTAKFIHSKWMKNLLPFEQLSKELEDFRVDFADTTQFVYVKTFSVMHNAGIS